MKSSHLKKKVGQNAQCIYTIELEIRNSTYAVTSASYVYLHIDKDINCSFRTYLYDNRNIFVGSCSFVSSF